MFVVNCFSQNEATDITITFDAKITEVESMGGKLNVTTIYITKDNVLTDSIITQNGRFKYDLTPNHIYKIEFSKKGYVSKHLVVKTTNPPSNVKKKSSLKVEVSLFKFKTGLNVDYLKSKPIGVAEFDIYKRKLAWDKEYTRIMIEKIIQSTLEFYDKNYKD